MTDGRQLHLAPGLNVDGPVAITKRWALLGQSESGKTNAVNVLAEELYPIGAPLIALDRVGNLYGLRSSASGDADGLPIAIFGGEHADVPLTPTSGAALARELVAARASAIVDVSEMTDEEARCFARDFLGDLYRYNRAPLHLLLDEAHEWAPERPETTAHWECRNAVVRIRKLGRNRGIGSTLASQSSAELAKAALGQTDALFALRTSAPTDVAPILKWAKGHVSADELRTIHATLGSLQVGEAWVISPGYLGVTKRIRFRLRSTFDSSRTPTLGEELREPRVFASVDLERIARAIEADAAGEIQPVVVRSPATIIRTEYINVITKADLERLEEALRRYREAAGDLDETMASIATRLSDIRATSSAGRSVDDEKTLALPARGKRPQLAAPSTTAALHSAVDNEAGRRAGSNLSAPKAGGVRMLVALARVDRRLSRRELGTLANINPTSGTMSEYVGDLKKRNLVTEEDGSVAITVAGREYIGSMESVSAGAPTTREILALHAPALKAGMRRILDLLVDVWPKELTRKVVGAQANINPTSGTMSEYISELRRRGLIEDTGRNGVRAAAILFIGDSAAIAKGDTGR